MLNNSWLHHTNFSEIHYVNLSTTLSAGKQSTIEVMVMTQHRSSETPTWKWFLGFSESAALCLEWIPGWCWNLAWRQARCAILVEALFCTPTRHCLVPLQVWFPADLVHGQELSPANHPNTNQ